MSDQNLLKILLVEDDEVDRMAFERFVATEGLPYACRIAKSVEEAKEMLEREAFDAILLDYNLGDGTGMDIISLKPDAPIILITGANQTDIAVSAMKAGAYDYLVKDQERDYLRILPIAVEGALRLKETEESRRILSHAVMSATDSVFITDLEGNVTFVNEAVPETYGYGLDELVGGQLSVIGPADADGEYVHKRKDGSEFPVALTRSAVKDDDGGDIAFAILAQDITERKQAEQELRRINEELEGYAHTVSHDLKGPLASTILATNTLKSVMDRLDFAAEEADIETLLEVIDNNVWKSAALIDDLLALAEAGQKPESLEDVDMNAVVRQVLEERVGDIEERGIEFDVGDDLGTVRGSPTHLYQLFTNLIGNCIKHCDSKKPVIKVALLSGADNGEHTYLVRDNGSGIAEENLERIFAPFFKGRAGGTGIGLATVEKIVKLYDGSVRAYNDNGACFELTIRDYPGD